MHHHTPVKRGFVSGFTEAYKAHTNGARNDIRIKTPFLLGSKRVHWFRSLNGTGQPQTCRNETNHLPESSEVTQLCIPIFDGRQAICLY